MTQSSLVPYFHWKYCPGSVYCCWGKRHLLFGVGFKQWGRFHWAVFCCSPLWEHHSEFQAVNCGWYMKSFFGTLGLGVAQWWRRWSAYVHVYGLSSFFFYNLTSFIFSQCEITIGLVEPNGSNQKRGKRARQRTFFHMLIKGKNILTWEWCFSKMFPHRQNVQKMKNFN